VFTSLPDGYRLTASPLLAIHWLWLAMTCQSKLPCDWRFTTNQLFLTPSPLRLPASDFFQLNPSGYSPYVKSSVTRGCLSFTIASDPRQHSRSRVRVPRDSWPYFTVSDSRLPQPGGPGPLIYNPRKRMTKLYSAGGLVVHRRRGQHKNTAHDNPFYCWACIRRGENVFTQPFPRNGLCNHVTILIPV
jgi:hypothetical protein